MGKYLKKFNSHAEYNAFTATTAFILPNVSLCVNEDDLHYNPLVRVSGVTLDKSELSIKEGDTETLVASVLPYNASNKNVVWSSSDDSIATVSSNGTVSGVSAGNADITVTTEDGGFTAQCSTSVKSYKVITYTATAKLPETSSTTYDTGGIHTNAFSGTSGQKLTMVSHTFEDGVGTITFNGDIATIGYAAFARCYDLTSIDIPDGVTAIGKFAFCFCSGMTSCAIGSGVTSIGQETFSQCYGLTSIVIPDGVTDIEDYAFHTCSGITSVTIGSGVRTIGYAVFVKCTSLTSIDIPRRVTSIGKQAFYNCNSLTNITVEATTPPTLGHDAFGFTNCPIYVPSGSVDVYKAANEWSYYASRIQPIV